MRLLVLAMIAAVLSGCASGESSGPADINPQDTNDSGDSHGDGSSSEPGTGAGNGTGSGAGNETDPDPGDPGNVTIDDPPAPPMDPVEPWSDSCTDKQASGAGARQSSPASINTGLNQEAGCSLTSAPYANWTSAIIKVTHNGADTISDVSITVTDKAGSAIAATGSESTKTWQAAVPDVGAFDLSSITFASKSYGAWQEFDWTYEIELRP